MNFTNVLGSLFRAQLESYGLNQASNYCPEGVIPLQYQTAFYSAYGGCTDYTTTVRNMVVIGIGLGPVMPVFTLASQSAVRVDQIGVATSLTQFARSIGGTLGTAIFGSVLVNSSVQRSGSNMPGSSK